MKSNVSIAGSTQEPACHSQYTSFHTHPICLPAILTSAVLVALGVFFCCDPDIVLLLPSHFETSSWSVSTPGLSQSIFNMQARESFQSARLILSLFLQHSTTSHCLGKSSKLLHVAYTQFGVCPPLRSCPCFIPLALWGLAKQQLLSVPWCHHSDASGHWRCSFQWGELSWAQFHPVLTRLLDLSLYGH